MAIPSKQDVIGLFYGNKDNNDGWKATAERGLREQHNQVREDFKAYAYGVDQYKRTDIVKFNRIKPLVDPVIGFFIQMRGKYQYQAKVRQSPEQSAYSEFMNGVADYARQNANADHHESRQDSDMLICGYGATDAAISWEDNPDGEYAKERIDPLEVWWEPISKQTNNMDSQYVFRRRRIPLKQAMEMLDAKAEDFSDDYPDQSQDMQFFPMGGVINKIGFDTEKFQPNLVNLYYLQWWDFEDYWRIENPLFEMEDPLMQQQLFAIMKQIEIATAEEDSVEDAFKFNAEADFLTVDSKLRGIIKQLLSDIGVRVEEQKFKKKVHYTALLSGTKVFELFRSPDQQGFTIKFKTGTWDNEKKIWVGLVRDLREPSNYYNKTLTEQLRIIASNSKGGVMYEEGAIQDENKFQTQWAKNASAIKVNRGALTGGQIQPKATPAMQTGYEKITMAAESALNTITPVNAEFLGASQNKQVSAAMEAQRIRQATTSLAIYADSIKLYQVEDARQMTSFVRILADSSQNRLIRLIGQDGAPIFEQLLQNRLADEYDVDIAEAPSTPTQKEEIQGIMMSVAQQMMATTGQNLYPIALRYLNGISEKDKSDMIDALTPPEPDPQQVAAQQQAEEEAQAIIKESQLAEIEKTKAEAQDKLAAAAQKAADSTNTEASTMQTVMENQIIANRGFDDVNLTI